MKVRRTVWNLRTRRAFGRIVASLVSACAARSEGLRIVHYSVQSDHVHLIVEHENPRSFSRSVQGLAVRIAKRLNAMMARHGKVFADRFHDRVLTSARQVRNALAYVLCNGRKHGRAPQQPGWLDPFSTAAAFEGWANATARPSEWLVMTMRPPRTWILRVGWQRAGGLLDVDHRPGAWSATR